MGGRRVLGGGWAARLLPLLLALAGECGGQYEVDKTLEEWMGPEVQQRRGLLGGGAGSVGGAAAGFRKLVALVPVRDEAHMLPSCLRSLAPIVDATVVLDDCSTDRSAAVAHALAAECKVERVERSPNCPSEDGGDGALPYWGDEAGHRGFLLELGRSVGGTHFVAIDADEAIVAAGGDFEAFRETFLGMKPGDLLVMHYMTLWGGTRTYRADKADMKAVGFVDQEGAHFARREADDRLHINRVPRMPRHGTAYELRNSLHGGAGGAGVQPPPHTAVLHFGFSSLANARLKNAVYNMFDIITGTAKRVAEMNAGYASQGLTLEAEGRVRAGALAQGPDVWWQSLGAAFNHSAFDQLSEWRERKVLRWLSETPGPARFQGLESMQGLARHEFPTLDAATGRRVRRMLRRLRVSW